MIPRFVWRWVDRCFENNAELAAVATIVISLAGAAVLMAAIVFAFLVGDALLTLVCGATP